MDKRERRWFDDKNEEKTTVLLTFDTIFGVQRGTFNIPLAAEGCVLYCYSE